VVSSFNVLLLCKLLNLDFKSTMLSFEICKIILDEEIMDEDDVNNFWG
jgi:hypothetical protein